MGLWSIECDTTGDGTFDDSVSDLLPFDYSLSVRDEWQTGYFKPKRTNFQTDASVNLLQMHTTTNKMAAFVCLTTFQTVLKLQDWLMGACHEYSHLDPKYVVRPMDGDDNVLTLGNNRFSFAIVTNLGFTIRAGDPSRIVVDITLQAVGYQ